VLAKDATLITVLRFGVPDHHEAAIKECGYLGGNLLPDRENVNAGFGCKRDIHFHASRHLKVSYTLLQHTIAHKRAKHHSQVKVIFPSPLYVCQTEVRKDGLRFFSFSLQAGALSAAAFRLCKPTLTQPPEIAALSYARCNADQPVLAPAQKRTNT
jgi:hypothetical protein